MFQVCKAEPFLTLYSGVHVCFSFNILPNVSFCTYATVLSVLNMYWDVKALLEVRK